MLTEKYKKIHFIGVGGISLSSLASYLISCGAEISGSDRVYSEKIETLNERGCRVWVGSHPEFINSPDLVIFSSAIKENDAELSFCREKGFLCLERNEFLNLLCDDFRYCIAVSGTHGKTTVTSMLVKIFYEADKKFFGHVGGDTIEFGNGYYSGNDYFVTEACEYRKSFLYLKPKIGIILNAETDHPDTYGSLKEVYDAFTEFAETVRKNSGLCIVNGDSDFYRATKIKDAVTVGLTDNNRFRATNVYDYKNGYKGFLICDYGNPIGYIKLSIPGEHNVINALCAFAAAYITGIPSDIICRAINSFKGVKRRFEYVCKYRGCDVYDDYAHHPSEIMAAIDTAKNISNNPLTVLFQPHTYSRTAKLFKEFTTCFDKADRLIILKEYAARETPADGKSAKELFDNLNFKEKYYCDNIIDAVVTLSAATKPSDTVLILGAGDVVNICDILKS